MFDFLQGKKTYLTALVSVGLGVAQGLGVAMPAWVMPVLIAAGLGSMRAAMKSAEKATAAAVDAIERKK